MPNTLANQKCKPCEGEDKALTPKEVKEHLKQVSDWKVHSNKLISREWNTKSFMTAVEFINKVAKLAEGEGHHPDIHLTSYRKLKIELSTHSIGGLSQNDFILAAKINKLPVQLKK